MDKSRGRTAAVSLLTVLLLSVLVFFVLRDDFPGILDNLSRVPPPGLLALAGLGLLYQVLDAVICKTLLRRRLTGFTLVQALEVTFLGVFGNVSTCAVGSIPMQSCYLQRRGLMLGRGVGILTLEYVFHKASVLLYASAMLALQGRWLSRTAGGLSGYLRLGCGVCLLVTAALVLACAWRPMTALLLRLISLLPDGGRWSRRKGLWSDNLSSLCDEAQALLKDRPRCLRALALNGGKLFCLYLTVYLSLRLLGVSALSLGQVQLLSAGMMLIVSALPNVAGVGPAEFAFFLIFSPYMPAAQASAALILYRSATYFLPFLASVWVFLRVQRRLFRRSGTRSASTPEPAPER